MRGQILRPHEFETHTPRPFLFELSTDSKIDLVADLESVDVNPILGHVADDAFRVCCHGRQFLLWCQILPNRRHWLFYKVRPIVAQKDDQVWFETGLLRTTRGLGGVVQSIDPIFTDPQADPGVLAPVLCEERERVNRSRPILPRLLRAAMSRA